MPLENILNLAESIGLDKEEVDRRIQEKYATYVRKGWLNNLSKLQEITGIKPSGDVYRAFIIDFILK